MTFSVRGMERALMVISSFSGAIPTTNRGPAGARALISLEDVGP